MAEWAQDLDGVNPFTVLADGLAPGDTMAAQTLVVVGRSPVPMGGRALRCSPGARIPPTPPAAAARICRTTRRVRRPPT
jgi:hypothetical protein